MAHIKLGTPHGNGCHRITIPIRYVEALGWEPGQVLDVTMKNDKIEVSKIE